MHIIRIALANLRKKKSAAITIILLVFLTTALLTTGIIISTKLDDYYMRKNDQLNEPHYVLRIVGNQYKQKYYDYFKEDPRVEWAEAETVAMMDSANYIIKDAKYYVITSFFKRGQTTLKNPDIPEEKAIYSPYILKNQGFQVGDTLSFEYQNEYYDFIIAGFFESTWFSTNTSNLINFQLEDKAYEQLYSQIGGGQYLSVRLHDLNDLEGLKKDYRDSTKISIDAPSRNMQIVDVDINFMHSAASSIPNLISSIFTIFSVLIFIILVITMRFRISVHIEDNIRNIGTLGALGYTSGQIRASILLEYSMLTAVGCLLGIGFSYIALYLLGSIIASSLGVLWTNSLFLGINLMSLVVILFIIFLTVLLSTRRIKKLPPVTALRSGIQMHNFKKNHFPLSQPILGLQFQMSCKNIACNFKQNVLIAVIIVCITFASAFSIITYANMSEPNSVIYDMIGERFDIIISAARHKDLDKLREQIEQMEAVKKTSIFETTSVYIESDLITCNVSDDFSQIDNTGLHQGSLPEYKNEIVLTGTLARTYGKKIGDTIAVSFGGVTAEYMICGLSQTVNNMGLHGILSLEGIQRLKPGYELGSFNVYLQDGFASADVIREIESNYKVINSDIMSEDKAESPEERALKKAEEKLKDLMLLYGVDSADYALAVNGEIILSGNTDEFQIKTIEDNAAFMKGSAAIFITIVCSICIMILIATMLIICFILYMIVTYMIIRRKKEFGILKALGYTTRQLQLQIGFSFLPVALAGSLIGCLLTGATLNSFISSLLWNFGMSSMETKAGILLFAGLIIFIVLFVFLIAMAVSFKVRKITAYELLID